MSELKANDLQNGIEIIFPDGIKEKVQFYSLSTVHCSKSKIPIKESLVVQNLPQKVNFTKSEEEKSFLLTTEKLKVIVSKSDGKISVFKPDSTVLIEEFAQPEFEKITVKGDEGYSIKQKFFFPFGAGGMFSFPSIVSVFIRLSIVTP